MKYLTTLLLCFAILLCGCEKKQEISEEQLELILSAINELEERRDVLFDYKVNPEDTFVENSMTFVKYIGKNNTFSEVCKATENICSPEVIEKLMHERYLYNFDGELYMHAAGGRPVYEANNDISNITVIKAKNNIVVFSLKKYAPMSDTDYLISKYVVKLNKDKVYVLEYEELYRYVVNTRNN